VTNYMKADTPTISVIICTRNRGSLVVDTLETVLASTHPAFEVILIDQSTNDDTEHSIDPYLQDPRLTYLRLVCSGKTRAMNVGLDVARGEVIVSTDDDCLVPNNLMHVMESIFQENPKVAVAFCNVDPGPHDPKAGFIPVYQRKDDQIIRNIWGKCRARGIGAGMAFRREVALDIGGFDDGLGAALDGDIAVRALINGWWLYETSQVAITHNGFRTWQQGKGLAKRNWIGIGAAYIKPVKQGRWEGAVVLLYEAFGVALAGPIQKLFMLRKPQGFRNFIYLWIGVIRGLKTPIDKNRLVYKYDI
jgi:glycosyltransferase involved in cell wall biosynthesis